MLLWKNGWKCNRTWTIAQKQRKIGKGADLYGAPLAIIICADHSKAWVRPFDKKQTGDIDASILTDHMMLQATELGLGSVWICCFKPDVIRKEFGLPDDLEPINILAVGYSNWIFYIMKMVLYGAIRNMIISSKLMQAGK